MAASRSTQRQRDRRASLAMSALAIRSAQAMSHGAEVVVTLRTRPVRKLTGCITRRGIRRQWKATGVDGESNLEIDIAGETVPLERVSSIEWLLTGVRSSRRWRSEHAPTPS